MLAIFDAQLSNIDSELSTLQSRLIELENLKKDLETKQSKASEVLESLKAIASDLAGDAIDNLKAAVMAIFPSIPSENSNSAPQNELFTNFMTEIPQILPTEEEIFDAECLPPAEPETVPPGSLVTIGTGDGGSISWVVPEEKPFAELVALNSTVAYQKKHDGEIICAYLGCASQNLAKEWANYIELIGSHSCEVRKAKRLQTKWEIKIRNIGMEAIDRLAKLHPAEHSPIPSNPEKKSESPAPTQQNNDSSGTGESSAATGNDASNENTSNNSESFLFHEPSNYDAITPEWDCYTIAPDGKPDQLLGRVKQHLTKNDCYQHSLLRGLDWQRVYFPSREAAAADLLRRKNADKTLHDRTNAQMRAAAGF